MRGWAQLSAGRQAVPGTRRSGALLACVVCSEVAQKVGGCALLRTDVRQMASAGPCIAGPSWWGCAGARRARGQHGARATPRAHQFARAANRAAPRKPATSCIAPLCGAAWCQPPSWHDHPPAPSLHHPRTRGGSAGRAPAAWVEAQRRECGAVRRAATASRRAPPSRAAGGEPGGDGGVCVRLGGGVGWRRSLPSARGGGGGRGGRAAHLRPPPPPPLPPPPTHPHPHPRTLTHALQVTRHNLSEALPRVRAALAACQYYALDCEMTGLFVEDRGGAYLDDLGDRYQEVPSGGGGGGGGGAGGGPPPPPPPAPPPRPTPSAADAGQLASLCGVPVWAERVSEHPPRGGGGGGGGGGGRARAHALAAPRTCCQPALDAPRPIRTSPPPTHSPPPPTTTHTHPTQHLPTTTRSQLCVGGGVLPPPHL